MLPTRKQWNNWSLPSKLTFVGLYVTVLGVILSIIFFLFPRSSKDENKIIIEQQLNNQIITEISNVIKSCETEKNKETGYGPSTTSLVLRGTKVIPNIFNFIAESVKTDMDFENPLFLFNFRKQLVDTPGFDCLVYSILKICSNDSSKEYQKYFQELLLRKVPAGKDVKQAIILSYILWYFENSEVLEIQNKLLTDNLPHIYDPIKKVLLRSYLFRNEVYFPIHTNTIFSNERSLKLSTAYSSDMMNAHYTKTSEILGIQDINNWQKLLAHIFSYEGMYDSFYRISKDNNATVKAFLIRENQSRFRNCLDQYLFGYDFFDMKMKYLEIDRVLLGKSFFHKSLLEHLKTDESNLIECQFHDSRIRLSMINNTVFDHCDFKATKLGRFSIFDAIDFKDSLLTDSSFLESLFFKCNFSRCSIKNLHVGASIFIECKFKNNTIETITFDSAFMDENSLDNFFENTSFSRDDFEIEIVGYSNESSSGRNLAATTLSLQILVWEMYNPTIIQNYLLKRSNDKKFYMIISKFKPQK
jgi:uncharacterized protein YjbI with pentapeptide repeats